MWCPALWKALLDVCESKDGRMKRDSIYGGQGQLPGIQNRLWQCLAPNQWPGTWGQRPPPWIYLLFEEYVGRYKSKNGEAHPTLILIITALPVEEKDFLNPVPFVGISHITPRGHLPTPPIWCLPCSASHHGTSSACWKNQEDHPDLIWFATWPACGATFGSRLKESVQS